MNDKVANENKNMNNNIMEVKIIERNVKEFLQDIEKQNKLKCWRYIDINIDSSGKKIPINENNKLPYDELQSKGRGNSNHNSLSVFLKYVPNLYVIDYDTNEIDCPLFNKLNDDCVAMTETRKGFHFYLNIMNVPEYSMENKVYKNKEIEVDLIKYKKNIWETKNRIVNGTIKTYEWNDIKKYFDEYAMGVKNASPPVSPPSSVDEEWGEINEDIILPKCNKEDFIKHLDSIKPRYDDFDTWLKVGFICYNNFDGNDIGFKIYNTWSKNSDKYDGINSIKKKWNEFSKQYENANRKLSYKQLLKWNMEDYPPKNKYEKWYYDGTLIENMNLECMYYTATGDILYYSNDNYIQNKTAIAKQFYMKYIFKITTDKKTEKINPFDVWLSSEDRKNVDKIVFNPLNNHSINEFNIWRGFEIKNTNEYNLDNISDWLNHIRHIWADDDENTYEYILNWFAKILQTPHKKNNICLVLHSVEGVGKSIILDMIGKIIGTKYYYSTSNLKHIIGDFNGDAEGKILVNLNETNWGGDKKMVGSFKEFITDSTIVINKKNKNSYTINNFSNTIITTNEDWIVNINNNDRRFNLRECKNVKYDPSYYKQIAKTPLQEIANFLYNRDITNYDSRVFEKSELHAEQIIQNLNSVEVFYGNLITGEIDYSFELDDEDCPVSKSDIYDLYKSNLTKNERQMNNVHFWRKFKNLSDEIIILKSQKKGQKGKVYIRDLDVAMDEWEKYIGLKNE